MGRLVIGDYKLVQPKVGEAWEGICPIVHNVKEVFIKDFLQSYEPLVYIMGHYSLSVIQMMEMDIIFPIFMLILMMEVLARKTSISTFIQTLKI